MYFPEFKDFERLATSGVRAVPVMRELVLDTETPVSVFQKLRSQGAAFLLESVEGGETWGRYSLLAAGGRTRIVLQGGDLEVRVDGRTEHLAAGDPLAGLRAFLARDRRAEVPGVPRFAGGAVGYLGYDLVRHFERLPDLAADDLELPLAQFLLAETVVVFDHLSHTVKLVHSAPVGKDPRAEYARAQAALAAVEALVKGPAPSGHATRGPNPARDSSRPRFVSGMGNERFLAGVATIRELIRAGEAVQVVLSHRLSRPFAGDPFDTYRALRVINPSPYMFYLDFGDLQLAGASPEVLVRVEGREVQVRPIAGTRPRGATTAEDHGLAAALVADPKEQAEHLMLVDLGRNDLGRVCDFGSVEVQDFHTIERYSHVMHLVSGVRGRLRPGLDCFDALRACFPAGTVSGAPKVRAMEIIESLEPTRRGIYAGAVGYVDYQGNLDTAIAIRTLVFHRGQAHVQVGAGIVADSTPEGELQETLAKAEALARAVEMAEDGLALPGATRRLEPAPSHLRRSGAPLVPTPEPR
jgi:anthranilate synthase component 1